MTVFHKQISLPGPLDDLYLPVAVNGCQSGLTGDNTGTHIADRNPWYSEMTALYWAWKNLEAERLGLCHYRRYFTLSSFLFSRKAKWLGILNAEQVEKLFTKIQIILPRQRRYYIETRFSQFAHAHGATGLDVARTTLQEHSPEYLPFFDVVIGRTWGHNFNMFIMRRDILDTYCTWLFNVLFAVEDRLRCENALRQRLMGYISERLLDVWLEHEKHPYLELPVLQLDRVNWPRKIVAFLGRKLRGGHV
ncbi:glycosyl transferase [Deltaproteobacteria bacterium]|nr:glycosyl transferase [Deltaproteobacteria bacterium]